MYATCYYAVLKQDLQYENKSYRLGTMFLVKKDYADMVQCWRVKVQPVVNSYSYAPVTQNQDRLCISKKQAQQLFTAPTKSFDIAMKDSVQVIEQIA